MFKDIHGALWKYKIVKIGKVEEGNVPNTNIITPIIFEHVDLYKQFKLIDDSFPDTCSMAQRYKIDKRKNNPIETYVKYGNYISDLKVGNKFTLGNNTIFDSWITSDVKYIRFILFMTNQFIEKNN